MQTKARLTPSSQILAQKWNYEQHPRGKSKQVTWVLRTYLLTYLYPDPSFFFLTHSCALGIIGKLLTSIGAPK
jgi:hypothetical protein